MPLPDVYLTVLKKLFFFFFQSQKEAEKEIHRNLRPSEHTPSPHTALSVCATRVSPYFDAKLLALGSDGFVSSCKSSFNNKKEKWYKFKLPSIFKEIWDAKIAKITFKSIKGKINKILN